MNKNSSIVNRGAVSTVKQSQSGPFFDYFRPIVNDISQKITTFAAQKGWEIPSIAAKIIKTF